MSRSFAIERIGKHIYFSNLNNRSLGRCKYITFRNSFKISVKNRCKKRIKVTIDEA